MEKQNQILADSKLEMERRNESLRREIDILNQDKTFLSRENASLEDKQSRQEDKLDRLERSLLEAKKQAEKYMDKVLNTNDEVKSKYDRKYS